MQINEAEGTTKILPGTVAVLTFSNNMQTLESQALSDMCKTSLPGDALSLHKFYPSKDGRRQLATFFHEYR